MDNKIIGEKFIASYYRVLYRNSGLISHFYDSHAIIKRKNQTNITTFQPCLIPSENISPFNVGNNTAKIFNYEITETGNLLMVSVYGNLICTNVENYFSQKFILKNMSKHWYIISDFFMLFSSPFNDVSGGDIVSNIKISNANTAAPFQKSNPSINYDDQRSFRPQNSPRHDRLDGFDPNRTITILNLPNSYDGIVFSQEFKKYGIITNKHFTHKAMYLEFDTSSTVDRVIDAGIQKINGAIVRIEKGKAIKEPKPYYKNSSFR